MDQQAQAVLKAHLSLSSRHEAKAAQGARGSQSTGQIHSLRTFDKYVNALKQAGEWARNTEGVRFIKDITPQIAQQYLEARAAEGIGQKQLDADRNALQFVTGKDSLERVQSLASADKSGRAYTLEQVHMIAGAQSAHNALATEIAHAAGLRAHELYTLQPLAERSANGHREWSPERFSGREGVVLYTVEGKGGLVREVALPRDLANRLEERRLNEPQRTTDRGIYYQQHYNLGAGKAWSQSVGDASTRALGWSTGAHGLRHAYAQERMKELQNQGKNYYAAREIVSQELGHFRGDVVETYLR